MTTWVHPLVVAPPDDNAPNYCTCNIPVRNEAPFWLPDPGDCAICDRPIRTGVRG